MSENDQATGTQRLWDEEDCPENDCNGELQEQDCYNVMCLSCETVYTHWIDQEGHFLAYPDGSEVVARG